MKLKNLICSQSVDEFANQRVAHPPERCGFDRLRRRAGVHSAGNIRPDGESRAMAVPCPRIPVHLPAPDGHLDGLRPELRPVGTYCRPIITNTIGLY